MGVGPWVRHRLGPLEMPISKVYRGAFFDLAAFADQIAAWISPRRILDIGCGEGVAAGYLAEVFPGTEIVGIDITDKVGRLFDGDRSRVRFEHRTIQDFAREHPAAFDLVLFVDVLHHAPWEIHRELLRSAASCLEPDGRLIVKDWESTSTPIHALAWFFDRFLTGDRIRNLTRPEMRQTLADALGEGTIRAEAKVRPWNNNMVFLVAPRPAESGPDPQLLSSPI